MYKCLNLMGMSHFDGYRGLYFNNDASVNFSGVYRGRPVFAILLVCKTYIELSGGSRENFRQNIL